MLADGRSIHTRRFAHELRRQGCEVMIASLERGNEEAIRLPRRCLPPFRHFVITDVVRRITRDFKADVINAHFASGYGVTAALSKWTPGPAVALNLWGSDILHVPGKSILHQWKTIYALRAADMVFADSHHLLSEAEKIASITSGHVISWGVEREALRLRKQSYRIGTPCRIIVPRVHAPHYGNIRIVEALRDLVEAGRISLTFPSSGPKLNDFRRRYSDLIDDGIELYEHMSRHQFLDFMADHDIYLSNAAWDSSPISLIEAMGLGLLPVVADVPGIDDWLGPENGFRFNRDKLSMLTQVISDILDSGDDYASIRDANCDKVEREGIFEDNVARHLDLMRHSVEAKV
jgi:glycosyltransferase involved in cell wall biosynthesis